MNISTSLSVCATEHLTSALEPDSAEPFRTSHCWRRVALTTSALAGTAFSTEFKQCCQNAGVNLRDDGNPWSTRSSFCQTATLVSNPATSPKICKSARDALLISSTPKFWIIIIVSMHFCKSETAAHGLGVEVLRSTDTLLATVPCSTGLATRMKADRQRAFCKERLSCAMTRETHRDSQDDASRSEASNLKLCSGGKHTSQVGPFVLVPR